MATAQAIKLTTVAPANVDAFAQYLVADFLVENVRNKVNKLVRRSKKLDSSPVTIETSETPTARLQIGSTKPFRGKPSPVFADFHTITISGKAPKLDGWKLVARLLHESQTGLDGVNIINAVPGETVNQEYRTSGIKCDHCGRDHIVRKDTYILRHDDGREIQVGSKCIKDFLGHLDPEQVVAYAGFWTDSINNVFTSDEYDEDFDFSGPFVRGEASLDLLDVLTVTCNIAGIYGYTSKAKAEADPDLQPTSKVVSGYLFRSFSKKELETIDKDLGELPEEKLEANHQKAIELVEWAKNLDDSESEYLGNLKAIANGGKVTIRTFGLAVSIYASKLREENDQARQENSNSEHLGKEGDKLTVDVTVNVVSHSEGEYGITSFIVFSDDDGNIIVWNKSGGCDYKKGDTLRIKGTVKGHGEFRGVKQTRLTRCKEVASDQQQAKLDNLPQNVQTFLADLSSSSIEYNDIIVVVRDQPIGGYYTASSTKLTEQEVDEVIEWLDDNGHTETRDDGLHYNIQPELRGLVKYAKAKKSKARSKADREAKKAAKETEGVQA
jgi:hypothetical protein